MIYLDNNATTRLAPEVLEAMGPFLEAHYGNASSAHSLGRISEGALVWAREQVARALCCQPAEIVFNSGGTEGLNQVFRGVFETLPAKRHFITTAVEHHAVQALTAWLKRQGAEVTVLGVDSEGRLDLEELEAAIRPDTALVSVMAANNETGVIFPIQEIAERVKARGALFHTDATQAFGKISLDLQACKADLLSLSAHKCHGPKGVGALFIRRGVRLKPFMIGGQQERDRRGGTENIPGIVGLGQAAGLLEAHKGSPSAIQEGRDLLEREAEIAIPDIRIHGATSPRVPSTSMMSFADLEGEALLLRLDQHGICASTGSACATGQREPSHVLRAMGVPPELARGAIRFSLSRFTTLDEIRQVASLLPELVAALRAQGPLARK